MEKGTTVQQQLDFFGQSSHFWDKGLAKKITLITTSLISRNFFVSNKVGTNSFFFLILTGVTCYVLGINLVFAFILHLKGIQIICFSSFQIFTFNNKNLAKSVTNLAENLKKLDSTGIVGLTFSNDQCNGCSGRVYAKFTRVFVEKCILVEFLFGGLP